MSAVLQDSAAAATNSDAASLFTGDLADLLSPCPTTGLGSPVVPEEGEALPPVWELQHAQLWAIFLPAHQTGMLAECCSAWKDAVAAAVRAALGRHVHVCVSAALRVQRTASADSRRLGAPSAHAGRQAGSASPLRQANAGKEADAGVGADKQAESGSPMRHAQQHNSPAGDGHVGGSHSRSKSADAATALARQRQPRTSPPADAGAALARAGEAQGSPRGARHPQASGKSMEEQLQLLEPSAFAALLGSVGVLLQALQWFYGGCADLLVAALLSMQARL